MNERDTILVHKANRVLPNVHGLSCRVRVERRVRFHLNPWVCSRNVPAVESVAFLGGSHGDVATNGVALFERLQGVLLVIDQKLYFDRVLCRERRILTELRAIGYRISSTFDKPSNEVTLGNGKPASWERVD